MQADIKDLILRVISANAVEIRDVEAGDESFLYSSGNWGPGYVTIKKLVGWPELFDDLTTAVAGKLNRNEINPDFVAGNLTGGLIPGWMLSYRLDTSFMYVEGTRRSSTKKNPLTEIDKNLLEENAHIITDNILQEDTVPDFVAGVVPGGMLLGHKISELLSSELDKQIPFVYIRQRRKKGGHKELITGLDQNPHISEGDLGLSVGRLDKFASSCKHGTEQLQEKGFNTQNAAKLDMKKLKNLEDIENPAPNEIEQGQEGLVVEELVNYAESTCNSAKFLREAGYKVNNGTCIMAYNSEESKKNLDQHNMNLVELFTLPELLKVAEENNTHSKQAIASYRDFLENSLEWQKRFGYEPKQEGGTQ